MPRQHAVLIAQFMHDGKMVSPRHRDQLPRQMRRRPQRVQIPAVGYQRRQFRGPIGDRKGLSTSGRRIGESVTISCSVNRSLSFK